MTKFVFFLPLVALIDYSIVIPAANALEFTDGSPCENICKGAASSTGDISYTLKSDLSCLDSDYSGDNSTSVGRKFKSCVGCELTSGTDDSSAENDIYWFLFNLKASVVWCVQGFFGSEQNQVATLANTRCNSACTSLFVPLQDRLLQTNESLQYNYCTANDGGFMTDVDKCSSCLSGIEGLTILGNFVSALKSACQQKPAPGKSLSLKADVFSITTPTTTPSSSSPAVSQTSTENSVNPSTGTASQSTGPTSTSTTAPASSSASSSSLSGGAIGGIAVSAIVGVSIISATAFLLLRRRKARTDKSRDYAPRELEGHHGQDVKVVYAHGHNSEMGAENVVHEMPGHTPELPTYDPERK